MPVYNPPLRDMQFVLHELLDVNAALKAMPKHAEVDADTINAVLERAASLRPKWCFRSTSAVTSRAANSTATRTK